jgi:WbqC-like protein family
LKLAVHQPNYAPWCGYFAKIRACDVFVFLDDAEISTGQSYVYRTRVRNEAGPLWLSVPTHRALHERIEEVRFAEPKWAVKHLNKLYALYRLAPCFREVFDLLEPLFRAPGEKLAEFNIGLIRSISEFLGVSCRWERASSFGIHATRDDRHIALAKSLGADVYLSGKGGQKYQDAALFEAAEIRLEVREYSPVAYAQVHGGSFEPGLSIVDALFNLGRKAAELLQY